MVADHLRAKIVKIGAQVVRHTRYTVFHVPEAALPKEMSFPWFPAGIWGRPCRSWLHLHLAL
jgi:hypothetical protein